MTFPVLPDSADSILPRFNWEDDNKRRYLSFRVCGFSRLESRKRTEVEPGTVKRWLRDDEAFAEIEQKNMAELRKLYSKEFIRLDFLRNMKLALDKDKQVLEKATDPDKRKNQLTKEEWQYLRSIRPLYTAKELNALEGIIGQFDAGTDWDELLIVARKNQGVAHGGGQESAQSTAEENISAEEYQEGSVVESGEGRWTSEAEPAEEDIELVMIQSDEDGSQS